jgi:predicted nuclease with TOPRIM domain
MKGSILRISAFVTVCAAVILVAGCEPEPASSTKQERLFAAENMELKKQIADMEKKHKNELAAKQLLLDKCEEEKEIFKNQVGKETIKELHNEFVNMLSEEVQRLHKENEQLKAQLEELTEQENTGDTD